MARKKKQTMSPETERPRRFGRRALVAAVCASAVVAALLLAVLFREAQSRQTRPDLAADALPRLNMLGRHRSEAAEYVTQIKARYAPTSAEYIEAKRKYEEAAEKFGALVDSLTLSLKENSAERHTAALREKSRLAVEAGDSFTDWADGLLQLLSRGRRAGGAPPKAAAAVEAAAALAGTFKQRDESSKARVVELMSELVKFKPWDEVPPITSSTDGASSTPTTAPSPTSSPAGR